MYKVNNNKILSRKMDEFQAEAEYRFGADNVDAIIDFFKDKLQKALRTAKAQLDNAHRKVFLMLGKAIQNHIELLTAKSIEALLNTL